MPRDPVFASHQDMRISSARTLAGSKQNSWVRAGPYPQDRTDLQGRKRQQRVRQIQMSYSLNLAQSKKKPDIKSGLIKNIIYLPVHNSHLTCQSNRNYMITMIMPSANHSAALMIRPATAFG